MALIFNKEDVCEESGIIYYISDAWEGLCEEFSEHIYTIEDFIKVVQDPSSLLNWECLLNYSLLDLKLLYNQPWRFPLYSKQFFNKKLFQYGNITLYYKKNGKVYNYIPYKGFVVGKEEVPNNLTIASDIDHDCQFEGALESFILSIKDKDKDYKVSINEKYVRSRELMKSQLAPSKGNKQLLFNNGLIENKIANHWRLMSFPGRFRKDQDDILGFGTGIDTENLFSFMYLGHGSFKDGVKIKKDHHNKNLLPQLVELCYYCQAELICPYFHQKKEWIDILDLFYGKLLGKVELDIMTGSKSMKDLKTDKKKPLPIELIYQTCPNPCPKFKDYPEFYFNDYERRYSYEINKDNLGGKVTIPVRNQETFVEILKENAIR